MPSFRPSAVLRLAIRLDEGGTTAALLKELQPLSNARKSSVSLSTGGTTAGASALVNKRRGELATLLKIQRTAAQSSVELDGEIGKARIALKQAQRAAGGSDRTPEAISGSSPDRLSLTTIGGIPVLRAEVQRASFRTMDKASFTLNYYEAPFQPNLMRAAAVELTMGVVDPLDFDAGMHGITRDDGSRLSQVDDPDGLRANTRFFGFITQWDVEYGEDGAFVYGRAEDAMSLLRDTPLPKEAELDMDAPIERGIQQLLNSFPALRGIPVRFGDGEQGPVPASAAARKKKLVGKKGHKRYKRVGEKTNVWDYITDVCVACGVIPVVEAYGLHITYARTLYGKRPEAPTMVWGRNIERLKFSRNLTGFKNPTVEVRCYQADKQQVYAARYPASPGYETAIIGVRDFPKKPDRAARVTPSGANPDEPIHVMTVANVADFQRLREIARGIYEETARQELEGSLTTMDPSSFGVDFLDANLLDLKAGDPLRIVVDARKQGVLADRVTELQGMSVSDRVRHLVAVGFKRQVAITYAALLDQANQQTIFRVKEVRLGIDHEEGLSIDVGFQNYITVRDDATRSDDIQAGPSPKAAEVTAGQSGTAAKRLRARSAARRTADAQAAAGAEQKPATSSQVGDERFSSDIQGQLQSDPDQQFSQ